MGMKKLTHAEFVNRVSDAHGGHIRVIGKYVGSRDRVKVRCARGHIWEPTASKAMGRAGCTTCNFEDRRQHHKAEFLRLLGARSKSFVVVGEYVNDNTPIKVQCLTCNHKWYATPRDLPGQKYCPMCAREARRNMPHKVSHEIRVRQIVARNPHFHVHGICDEPGSRKRKVDVECSHCGKRGLKLLGNLIRVYIKCSCRLGVNSGRGYSNASIAWLSTVARKNRVVIEHAANKGEFKIPGTRLHVDGFHRRSKTVFEFLGNYWHPDKKRSMARLRRIKAMGYNVVYIWESDYKQGKPARYL